mmetsp:Transcript_2497/g.3603  ORF Transcript_2497/g.3603 Transcript_2497/m.3603 type:complete len:314 (-) Transcript_2497:50-991(-)|eukprot:CAMPEP_0167752628 /NCGR_PEP_ID=MMETSP0110_2-20121227/7245_1 /TAXON_ID=629695 /ORGANISM="Gymnochlora sp., Strain CCMP2014" /LENGTH=313 /DNA_ID=CAMNT_0007638267 /DNA_START=241 /DNA_END=1182 /DNA_ORIENTATION=+
MEKDSKKKESRNPRQFILRKLKDLEEKYGFEVLFASERGSHVWGTACEESDWDVKFVYKFPLRKYITAGKNEIPSFVKHVYGPRAKIETERGDWDIEISGFELRDAASKIRSTDPCMFEILFSPTIYHGEQFVAKLREVTLKILSWERLKEYYIRYGKSQMSFDKARKISKLKSKMAKLYGYSLRAFLSYDWMVENICESKLDTKDLVNGIPFDLETLIKYQISDKKEIDTLSRVIKNLRSGKRGEDLDAEQVILNVRERVLKKAENYRDQKKSKKGHKKEEKVLEDFVFREITAEFVQRSIKAGDSKTFLKM